ncbi:tyrosine recombinase XerD [Clostridium acetireducens DSM 10703]|uniref:Tyrosine recombinase XerD n=1 Tax=Clostridium acetireducens DSM 10703 TaxID=1121290 RepID=A0A1E8EWI4_9CLOT|nr:tyrosine-type recombinase/integrase [Clostridium acetireducens]OFI04960.1 tyrosine recombinase XerD [Clostridium acetireducens DSM 10703]
MQIKDAVREYIYEITIKNYAKRTIKGYKNNILKFTKYIQDEFEITELEEVSKIHIKKYLSYLQQKGLSEVYINNILKNIRSFFKYCQAEGYCINVAKKVSWLKEKKVIIKTFNDKEIKKMLEVYSYKTYIQARNKCIIATLIDTGVRNNELCSLTRLDVRETVIYIQGKGNKERVVPISPYLKKIMIKYERIRDVYLKDNILHYNNYFLSYRNKPLTIEAVERVVKIAGEKANVRKDIRCSPHTIRHYFAQTQLKNGLDVYSLSRLLGHESINITKRYLESLEDKNVVEMSIKTSPLMNLR